MLDVALNASVVLLRATDVAEQGVLFPLAVPKQQGEATLGPAVGVAPQTPTARGRPGLLALLVRDG
eukprot:9658618-Lingulodinium_polyedra.AAC.1